MTETECFNCDYSENCDWELILKNTVPMTPNCMAKAWHDRSLKQFKDMTYAVREKIEGGGEVVVARKVVTVGQFCENSKNDRDLM